MITIQKAPLGAKKVVKPQAAMAASKALVLPEIPKALLDSMNIGIMTGEAVNATAFAFKKALIERALNAEISHHLGYAPGEERPASEPVSLGVANHRNGDCGKTVLTDDGPVRIDFPRDRAGEFEPRLIGTHERRITDFDDKSIAMYARGMTMRW